MSRNFTNANKEGPKNTLSDVWLTPPWIIDLIGISDLDPCGWLPDGEKPIVQTAHHYFTEKDNGLEQDWFGSVFVNFPYSDAKNWMKKVNEYYVQTLNPVIVLCFVRSETQWFQEHVRCATGINLIRKRISFLNAQGEQKTNGNAPSCLIAYGESAFERIQHVPGLCFRREMTKLENIRSTLSTQI